MGRWWRPQPRLHYDVVDNIDHADYDVDHPSLYNDNDGTDDLDLLPSEFVHDDDIIGELNLLNLLNLLNDLDVGDRPYRLHHHIDDLRHQFVHFGPLDLIYLDVHDCDRLRYHLVVRSGVDLDDQPDRYVNVDHLNDDVCSQPAELHQVGHLGDAARG